MTPLSKNYDQAHNIPWHIIINYCRQKFSRNQYENDMRTRVLLQQRQHNIVLF